MNWTIIRTEKQYKKALSRLDEIFDASNDDKNSDEFDLLCMLIKKYEEENYAIEPSDPIKIIKLKMEYMNLKQKDLIPYFGSKSTTSKILAYKAPLTLKHIWLLSKKLELLIELLAKPYRVTEWNFMKKYDAKTLKGLKAKF